MQRQRGELVPIGEDLADLGGPIQALRETPPPARRGFTVADQVNQLVSASEADPELGFMARLLALCSLPRTNPKNRHEFKRVKRPVHALHGGWWRQQITLRHPAASAAGVGVHRSGTDAITRAHPRRFALGVHAEGGHLQHQRRQAHQTSESDATAVWVHGLAALRGCARGSHAERADCPSHGVLVERAPAGRARYGRARSSLARTSSTRSSAARSRST